MLPQPSRPNDKRRLDRIEGGAYESHTTSRRIASG
jgi:hypothetical protein